MGIFPLTAKQFGCFLLSVSPLALLQGLHLPACFLIPSFLWLGDLALCLQLHYHVLFRILVFVLEVWASMG